MADERQEEVTDALLPSAVAAGLLREYAGDREAFLSRLVRALEAAVPERLAVDRSAGWFGRERAVRRVQVALGDHRYQLEVGQDGALAAERARAGRGIALPTEALPVEEWVRELSAALVEYARTHEAALEALRRQVW